MLPIWKQKNISNKWSNSCQLKIVAFILGHLQKPTIQVCFSLFPAPKMRVTHWLPEMLYLHQVPSMHATQSELCNHHIERWLVWEEWKRRLIKYPAIASTLNANGMGCCNHTCFVIVSGVRAESKNWVKLTYLSTKFLGQNATRNVGDHIANIKTTQHPSLLHLVPCKSFLLVAMENKMIDLLSYIRSDGRLFAAVLFFIYFDVRICKTPICRRTYAIVSWCTVHWLNHFHDCHG